MEKKINKLVDSYQKNTLCNCDNSKPDMMYIKSDNSERIEEKIMCHCKACGGQIFYE